MSSKKGEIYFAERKWYFIRKSSQLAIDGRNRARARGAREKHNEKHI